MSLLAFSAGSDECAALRARVNQMRELFEALSRGDGPHADNAHGAVAALANAAAALSEAEAVLAAAIEVAA